MSRSKLELDRDPRGALPRGRGDLLHALDRGDHLLQDVDHVGLDDLGRSALPGDRDVHHREVHVRVLADAEPVEHGAEAREGQQPETDEREHQDPGEHVVADRDVRERHPGRDLVRVLGLLDGTRRLGAHFAVPFVAPSTGSTGIPSARRSEPSETTTSPFWRPDRISTTPVPVRSPSPTGRTRAVLVSSTT